MKISIVMPVYNAEEYIKNTIKSIQSQSFSDYELIIVDDGSTDSSFSICDEYSKQDVRIKVIHQQNGGVGAARLTGIMQCKGEYIGFCDDDDCIHPQMFELMYNVATTTKADIVMCDFDIVGNNENVKKESKYNLNFENVREVRTEVLYDYLLGSASTKEHSLTVLLWNKIYRKDLLQQAIPNYPSEDIEINCRVLHRANKIMMISYPLYHWVFRNNSQSHYGINRWYVNLFKYRFNIEEYLSSFYSSMASKAQIRMFKDMLRWREESRGTIYKKEIKSLISKRFPVVKQRFLRNSSISFGVKVMYLLLFYFPILYKIYKIATEYVIKKNEKSH